jgi:hypothetical protein
MVYSIVWSKNVFGFFNIQVGTESRDVDVRNEFMKSLRVSLEKRPPSLN